MSRIKARTGVTMPEESTRRPIGAAKWVHVLRQLLLAGICLAATVACATFEVGVEATPTAEGVATPVATIRSDNAPPTVLPVAQTLEATTQVGDEEGGELLPARIYFINKDDSQIWRVEKDGVTLRQVTFEDAPVTDFDVSPKDGALVYISDNQLIYLTLALEGRRQVLVSGVQGLADDDYLGHVTEDITDPVWSPDGDWIAFGKGGITLFKDPGMPGVEGVPEIQTVLANDPLPDPLPAEGTLYEGPQRRYGPLLWLAGDEDRLLVSGLYYFALGSFQAILNLSDGSLQELELTALPPCCSLAWAPQSNSLLFAGSQPGMFANGLTGFNPDSVEMTSLVPGEHGGRLHLFAHPFESSRGPVYGFYNSEPVQPGVMPFPLRPMVMVSVDETGSAEVTRLSEEYFVIGEADWLPDGSGAVITDVAGFQQGGFPAPGILRWLPSDGRPPLALPAQGIHPRWGK